MTVTVVDITGILQKRTGAFLTAAGMTLSAYIDDPLIYALRQNGYTTASLTSITDDDLDNVADEDYDMVLAFAELALLETILGNLALVDITAGPLKQSYSQLGARLEKLIASKRARIALLYGIGLGTFEGGTISHDFEQHGPEAVVEE